MITLRYFNYHFNISLFSKSQCRYSNLFSKRFMFKQALKRINDIPTGKSYFKPIAQQYSTRTTCQFKGKAAKDLANDHTGKHTHVIEEKCIVTDCENQKCPSLCDNANGFAVKGHNTHKPPVGRMTRFVSEKDANGVNKPQYFVPSNTKKEVTEQDRQQKYSKDIKPDPKQQAFVTQHDDKYE